MKIDWSNDSFSFDATDRDIEFAKAARDTLDGLRSLATAVGIDTSKPEPAAQQGTCPECGEEKPLLPLPGADGEGNPVAMSVCAPCQKQLVDRQLKAQAEAQAKNASEKPGTPVNPSDLERPEPDTGQSVDVPVEGEVAGGADGE